MANENYLDITELDYDGIKANLIAYLKTKPRFAGYDFEGSSLNILMDILAYNTHYLAFYASMVGNEMFIDSAARRDSVVSHSKMLNYVPRSTTSARAIVNLQRTTSATINRGNFVTGTYTNENNETITKIFTFLEDYEYEQRGTNDWRVDGAVLSEGILQTITYVYDAKQRERKFLLPADADISTVRVRVRQAAAASEDDTETWFAATDFSTLGPTEKVFFVQAAYDGQYEVYFGDNVIGASLNTGNIVYIDYLQSSGTEGNFFSNFSLSNTAITTVAAAVGGQDPEDITEIRKNAPKAFVAQNRTVTARDYESVIQTLYPQAESIKVWGGEENNPPQYGKVFVSIKPTGGLFVSSLEKRNILEQVKQKSMVGIVPEIVDPEYLYAVLNITTTFDPRKTSLSRNEISALQRAEIVNYFDNTLEKFDTSFYVSKLNKILDEVDPSVLGTSIGTLIEQRIQPSTRYPNLVELKFFNPLFHPHEGHIGAVRSSTFSYRNSVGEVKAAYIEDDGYGKLSIVTGAGSRKRVLVDEAGEVSYISGDITLFAFKPEDYGNINHIKIRVQPASSDIFSTQNKIITTRTEDIKIRVMTKEEMARYIRTGSTDYTDSLTDRNLIPEGPVQVQAGAAIRSVSPFTVPSLPAPIPLPNAIPIITPDIGV
jgi:hypothetical protein